MVEPERPQMTIWRRVACWIIKAKLEQANVRALAPTTPLPPAHTHSHPTQRNMSYLLLFHTNNSCVNAPECYVTRTLPVLLLRRFSVFTARYELKFCNAHGLRRNRVFIFRQTSRFTSPHTFHLRMPACVVSSTFTKQPRCKPHKL
jgi:hypothetical protein